MYERKIAKANSKAETLHNLICNTEYFLERYYGGAYCVYNLDGDFITMCRKDCFYDYRDFETYLQRSPAYISDMKKGLNKNKICYAIMHYTYTPNKGYCFEDFQGIFSNKNIAENMINDISKVKNSDNTYLSANRLHMWEIHTMIM